ncbi:MAG: SEC-C domain-containing protein [Pseudomonadota bacterium]
MKNTGRNDPCPCGSGKKFKKCHLGREDELYSEDLTEITVEEMGEKITRLPEVSYGRSKEMVGGLDIQALTGKQTGIKFVDLESYFQLNFSGAVHRRSSKKTGGGLFINLYKTVQSDPDNIYVAISPDIDESTLTHELAHVLDYLGGSHLMPGTLQPLSLELGIPPEHLEHPEEFGYWFDYLHKRFAVQLDADDAIVSYLYSKGMLIKGEDIREKKGFILKSRSDRILKFLGENSEEVDDMIRNLPGYIGPRKGAD